MPRRKVPLVTGEYYHIFNRGVNKQPIFEGKRDYKRATEIIGFYTAANTPLRYSKFMKLPKDSRIEYLNETKKQKTKIELIAFCLMPNHFHFLIKQSLDQGIVEFMRQFQISHTNYFNKKYARTGPLLQGQFKNVLIEDEKQLLHLTRYIHLNPYTSHVINSTDTLSTYAWSSFPEYLGKVQNEFCNKKLILQLFENANRYRTFVLNHADYQKKLSEIKHLSLDLV